MKADRRLMVKYAGKTQSLAEWCHELKLPYSAVHTRLRVYGWPPERALSTPVKRYCVDKITYRGKTKSLAEWCRELGLKYGTAAMRINKKRWAVELAFKDRKNR